MSFTTGVIRKQDNKISSAPQPYLAPGFPTWVAGVKKLTQGQELLVIRLSLESCLVLFWVFRPTEGPSLYGTGHLKDTHSEPSHRMRYSTNHLSLHQCLSHSWQTQLMAAYQTQLQPGSEL